MIGKIGEFGSYPRRMKKSLFLLSCAVGFLLMPARAEEKETALGKQMEGMNDAYKAFRKETDPVKGAALAREAQQAALKSAAETPEMLTAMPEGPEKAKAQAEYRKMMGKLFVSLCEVEEAFLNGKMEDVAKIVEDLKEQKKVGHEKFIKEEE
jgi:soluble cytochrome b562